MRRIVSSPGWLVLLPTLMSLVVWRAPWPSGVRRGYAVKEHLTSASAFTLFAWYFIIAAISTIGWFVGRQVTPINRLDQANDDRVYRFMGVLGITGVMGMYLLVEAKSPGLIFRALSQQQFNLVRQAVPQTPGVATLRYATIVSGAIALHRRLIKKERQRIHYLNILMLILNVLVASRLALLMAILVFIGLTATRRENSEPRIHRRGRYSLLAIAVLFILGFANYSRNANFYELYYHTSNPVTMLVGETVAYVGAPFQVSVGTANAAQHSVNPAHGLSASESISYLSTPTFFTTESNDIAQRANWYRDTVSVDPSLTTNSSFATEYGLLGPWAFPFAAIVAGAAGFLMGHTSRYKSYLMLASFVIGYCFFEVWRTYLFNEGIVSFLLLALVAGCTVTKSGARIDAIQRHKSKFVPVR